MVKTKCEVYSRVVGYLRPVQQWNEGKAEEFRDRTNFSVSSRIDDDAPLQTITQKELNKKIQLA